MQDSQQSELDLQALNDSNPSHLRKVINRLIGKSNKLIQNLETLVERLDRSEQENAFWKRSYFLLKDSCEQYVETNGLQPFHYIGLLQEEIRKEKIERGCLREKYKDGFEWDKHNLNEHTEYVTQPVSHQREAQRRYNSTVKIDKFNKSISTKLFQKESPTRKKRGQKGRVGPKNINIFKFGAI